MSYDADAQAYFDAVEAVSDFDLTAIETWLTPSYVKGHVDKYVKGLKSDNVWSAMLNSCLWIGPRTIDGAFVKLKGSPSCSILNGTFTYDSKFGITSTAGNNRIDTGQTTGGTLNNVHCCVWVHTAYGLGNGRYLDAGASNEIIGSSGNAVRFRPSSTLVSSASSSLFSDGIAGYSRNNSLNYDFAISTNTGNVTFNSAGGTVNNVWLFGDGANSLTNQTLSMFSTGTATDLTKIRDRFAALKSALSTFTPVESYRRNHAFIGTAF